MATNVFISYAYQSDNLEYKKHIITYLDILGIRGVHYVPIKMSPVRNPNNLDITYFGCFSSARSVSVCFGSGQLF